MPKAPTVAVRIGAVTVGGGAPVVVQSMTNTDTADVEATARQVRELAEAGSELVRVTVNTDESAAAVPHIRDRLRAAGCDVPIIGDFHFNGHKLLAAHPDCAEALAKYRINPGNVGRGSKRDPQFAAMIETACRYRKPVRIGVNWGSLDQDLLTRMMDENSRAAEPLAALDVLREATVVSALASAARAEELGLPHDAIVVSAKVSGVQDLVAIYRALATRCDYPLHLGLTEAGMGAKGIVSSTAALAILLQEGIGDTIRVSLTPEPGGDRRQEVRVAQEILQSLGLRAFLPRVVACPGCGRTTSSYFQELAQRIQDHVRERMPAWRRELHGRRDHDRRGHGLRRKRPRREQARQHRHQPARHRRTAGRAGVRGRREDGDAQGRAHRRGIPGTGRTLRGATLSAPGGLMEALKERKCVPCEGGVRPLDAAQAGGMMKLLHADWQLVEDGTAIRRALKFPDFWRTMSFVNALAHVANVEDHHPDLEIGYNYCRIRYSTHAIGGLSDNDFICAAKADALLG